MSDFPSDHEQLAEKRKYDQAYLDNNSYNNYDYQDNSGYDNSNNEKKQATDDSYNKNRTSNASPFLSVIPTPTNSSGVPVSASTDNNNNATALITVNMSCPQDRVPALIGPKGVTVQSIIKQSGCNKIFVDQDFPDGVPRQVNITGKPQSVSIAVSLVTQLLAEGSLVISPGELPTVVPSEDLPVMVCPHSKVASLIGPQGGHVNEIMRRSGARVQVIQEGVPDGVDRKLSFSGTTEQVLEARQLVQQLLIEGPTFLFATLLASGATYTGPQLVSGMVAQTPSGSLIAEDDIQPEKVRVVIGSKGVTINEMMARSGCRININQNFPLGMPHRINYCGSKDQIEVARFLVSICVEKGLGGLNHVYNRGEKLVYHEVNVLQSQMIRLLGSQGINMGDVQMRLHVKVNVDTVATMLPHLPEPVNKIGLVGHTDNVQEAVSLIYQYVDYVNPNPAAMGMMKQPNMSMSMPIPMNNMNMNMSYPTSAGYGGGYPSIPMSMAMQQPPQPLYNNYNNNYPYSTTPIPQSVAPPVSSQVLGLGEDGSAGQLEPAKTTPDGLHQQVAEIKANAVGRVVGKQSATIVLIRNKSGANVQVMRSSDPNKTSTTIVMTGLPQCVALAAQMVQEVLVNGIGKLQQMNDVPLSVQPNNSSSVSLPGMTTLPPTMYGQYPQTNPGLYGQPQYQQQQQYQQQYMNPGMYGMIPK